jgi:hypothetical protein
MVYDADSDPEVLKAREALAAANASVAETQDAYNATLATEPLESGRTREIDPTLTIEHHKRLAAVDDARAELGHSLVNSFRVR